MYLLKMMAQVFQLINTKMFSNLFFRLDQSRNQNKSGVGLGMSIAEDIIRSHGGNIELGESQYKGLLIKISLPF